MSHSSANVVYIEMRNHLRSVIDDEDADLVQFHWSPATTGEGLIYPRREVLIKPQIKNIQKRKVKTYFLHRVVLERKIGRALLRGEICDHINGDTLNNLRSNLRVATPAQSIQNTKRPVTNSCGYKGVWFSNQTHTWMAYITSNGVRHYLGSFPTPEEAHRAYCLAALEYNGEFARFE